MFVRSQVEQIQEDRRQDRALMQENFVTMQQDREAQARREEAQARREEAQARRDEAQARRDSLLMEHLEAIRRMEMRRGAGSSGSGSVPDDSHDDAPAP